MKNAAAKNRRVLGDIGNIASLAGVHGVKPPANRPFTRNFRSQLLENAQVGAAANKKVFLFVVCETQILSFRAYT